MTNLFIILHTYLTKVKNENEPLSREFYNVTDSEILVNYMLRQ
jgi:hypothetical protein